MKLKGKIRKTHIIAILMAGTVFLTIAEIVLAFTSGEIIVGICEIATLILLVLLARLVKEMNIQSQELKTANAKAELIMDEFVFSIIDCDLKNNDIHPSGRFAEVNNIDMTKGMYHALNDLEAKHEEVDVQAIRETIQNVIKTRKADWAGTAILYDSSIHWMRVVIAPLLSDDGEVDHILFGIFDETQAHDAFSNAEKQLALSPGGMHRCRLGPNGRLEYASEGLQKMLNYSHEEFQEAIGDIYTRAIVEEDRDIFRGFVRRLAEGPGVETIQYRMVTRDGKIITVSDTMESVLNSNGNLIGYSTVTDITELVENTKKLQELQKEKINELKEELKDAKIKNSVSQMQPHFLYNALASIREIVLDNPEYASELIFDFSTHLRACIRAMSHDDLIPFDQEMTNIQAYVNIEKMRFGSKLKVAYEIKDNDFTIVPLSIQPLVENAIRHGIYERGSKGGTVKVVSEKGDNCHIIRVIDDGVGFDYKKIKYEVESGERDSTGLYNLQFRLEKLMCAEVIVDSIPGRGTTITVKIPCTCEVKDENNSSR